MTTENTHNIEGIMHGPYKPLSDEEIVAREQEEYGHKLSDEEKIALQAMHQASELAWSYTEAGRTTEAAPLHNNAQAMHLRLLNHDRSHQ